VPDVFEETPSHSVDHFPNAVPSTRDEYGPASNNRRGKINLPARRHATSALESWSGIDPTTSRSRDQRSSTSNAPPRHPGNIREAGGEENTCVDGLDFDECVEEQACCTLTNRSRLKSPL